MTLPSVAQQLATMTGTATPKPTKRGPKQPRGLKRSGFKQRVRQDFARAAVRKTFVDGVMMIAGLQWPAKHKPESQFQAEVEKLAEEYGWLAAHAHLPYYDTAGWPDCAFVTRQDRPGPKRFLVRELKVRDIKGNLKGPTPMQWTWIYALADAGVDVGWWAYPDDLAELEAELAR